MLALFIGLLWFTGQFECGLKETLASIGPAFATQCLVLLVDIVSLVIRMVH